jgi:hypothetical protein
MNLSLFPLYSGSSSSSFANSYTENMNSVVIGTRGDAFGYAAFDGLIDDVHVYNRALTAAQAAAMYNARK